MTDEPQISAESDEIIIGDPVPVVADNSDAVEENQPENEDQSGSSQIPQLIVKRNGIETDTAFPVPDTCIIGRFDPAVGPIDVDLGSLPEGVYVSRKHAKIMKSEDGSWMLLDLGSSNGTFVLRSDFERVEGAPLEDGTEFALGNARFVFRLS